eukprot:TRINITY_DN19379_c0_g1_i1.p1 TRINITY_DN19379_c0_g1~~TRINITY_DN19379_c0_g1_i1.p1  ORF type:complete len:304 (+),score=53.13 TRINITY_DN19379_c0_g1_i1:317-1228(+)
MGARRASGVVQAARQQESTETKAPPSQQQRRPLEAPRQDLDPQQQQQLRTLLPHPLHGGLAQEPAKTPELPDPVRTRTNLPSAPAQAVAVAAARGGGRARPRGCRGGRNLQRSGKAFGARSAATAVATDASKLPARIGSDLLDVVSEVSTDAGQQSGRCTDTEETPCRSVSKASSCSSMSSEAAEAHCGASRMAEGDIISALVDEGSLVVKNTFYAYVEPRTGSLRRARSAPCLFGATGVPVTLGLLGAGVAKLDALAKESVAFERGCTCSTTCEGLGPLCDDDGFGRQVSTVSLLVDGDSCR